MRTSKLLENERNGLARPVATNERCICKAGNITIIPMYCTYDSLSYQISRCNYCREEWAEYWISYRYIVSSLIYQHQYQSRIPKHISSIVFDEILVVCSKSYTIFSLAIFTTFLKSFDCSYSFYRLSCA